MADMKDITARKFQTLVGRIARLQQEPRDIRGEIEEIYAEAWNAGIDLKTLESAVVRRLRRAEGVLSALPLGGHLRAATS
jgi:uncharacterized protein (UPF0335 family)